MNIAAMIESRNSGRVIRDEATRQEFTVTMEEKQYQQLIESATNMDAHIDRLGAPQRTLAQARQKHEGALWSEIGASLDPALWHGLHQAREARDKSLASLEAAQRASDAHQLSRPRSLDAVSAWADTGRKLEREVLAYTEIVTEARRLYQTAVDAVYEAFTAAVAQHAATAQQAHAAESERHHKVVAESEQRVKDASAQLQAAQTLARRLREQGIAIFEEVRP